MTYDYRLKLLYDVCEHQIIDDHVAGYMSNLDLQTHYLPFNADFWLHQLICKVVNYAKQRDSWENELFKINFLILLVYGYCSMGDGIK